MALLSSYKVKASSITESIVAMVIIAVCLSITMVVYVRVLEADRNIPSYAAEQKVKELLWETQNLQQFVNEAYSFPNYSITKEVEELFGNQEIYQLRFTVKTGKQNHKYQFIVANN